MPEAKAHSFREASFQSLQYCDYCQKVLWGFARQGCQCSECGYTCHHLCSRFSLNCHQLDRNHMGDDRSSVFTDSDRESVSRFSTRSEVSTMTSSRQRTKKSSGFESDTPNAPLRVVEDASKSSTPNTAKTHRRTIQQHVQDSMAQATLNGVWNPNVSILSPRATGKAFSKFVSRATPITNAMSYFNHVYHWQQPVVSFSYLIFWSLLCLYPSIILLIPPLVILLTLPQLKSAKSISDILLPTCTDETSPQYFSNLRTVQDILTQGITIHDRLTRQLTRLSQDNTRVPLGILGVSGLISSIAWIFGRQLIWFIGCMILLRHTWMWQVAQKAVGAILEVIQTLVDAAGKLGLIKANPTFAADPDTLEISIFENQRWWAGSGFTGQLLRAERKPWTNITGAEPLVPKEDMPPPIGFRWTDKEWHLDESGPWMDSVLGIGE
ncbi:hypothetical protein K450DRAFT_260479 [Umbelopsis ramanniana AG]|uniref:Phorbol-ester/DAG-type domain-containing protein n=1 Tax=Umbelopsis ramanniana AG TaxID=1314678 RepID=A0AAD5HAP6_UMBRA|nr:uncharacterized protein K450DRAFT_260479 [Umbelopsis ramanniana AG]KAI8575716.1 hypothetical protein K450DRAFT_260479 [Umbelopsis ramanniana AG]